MSNDTTIPSLAFLRKLALDDALGGERLLEELVGLRGRLVAHLEGELTEDREGGDCSVITHVAP